MPKHNQTARLGDLTDFAASPPALDPDTRITVLERRVATLEGLLNDVMQQLDRPFREQPRTNGKPKQAKPPARAQAKKNASQSKTTPGVAIPEGVTTEILSAVEAAVIDTPGQQRSAIAKAIALDAKVCGRALSHLCNIKHLRMTTQNDADGKKRTLFWSKNDT